MIAQASERAWRLEIIDRWALRWDGRVVSVPRRDQRLVAYLALHHSVPRLVVAGALWPEVSEAHAQGSLRTAAGHLRTAAPALLAPSRDPLDLSDGVRVDLRETLMWAHRAADEPDAAATVGRLIGVGQLLPGWYEDWVLCERERLQQLLIVTLEQLTGRLVAEGDLVTAYEASALCVQLEPLRESAHRLLAQVHLAAGNRIKAWEVYVRFRRRSIHEFGLAPDRSFEELIAPLVHERQQRKSTPGPSGDRTDEPRADW